RMLLPTTLSTFRGLLVAVDEQQFVLPSRNVERVVRVPMREVKTVENRETVTLDRHVLSLVRLADTLGLAASAKNGAALDYLLVAVLASGATRIAFAVDGVLGDQEVLVKDLGPQLVRVPNVAGATVLGAGRVVSILNVA